MIPNSSLDRITYILPDSAWVSGPSSAGDIERLPWVGTGWSRGGGGRRGALSQISAGQRQVGLIPCGAVSCAPRHSAGNVGVWALSVISDKCAENGYLLGPIHAIVGDL